MVKTAIPKVLFNASVVLAGLKSPKGGSAKVLAWIRKNKIVGIISEPIFDEALRNAPKIKMTAQKMSKKIKHIFTITDEPDQKTVREFKDMIIDFGDAHVLASARQEKVAYLVTLDKKHLLILEDKIKDFGIVTPGQLIELLK